MRYSRRQVIKQGALMSVAGAAMACSNSPGNISPAAVTPVATTAAAAPFSLRITIHGAYGLIKRRSGGLTVASLVHPPAEANPCKYDYSKHDMLIVVRQGSVNAGATTHKATVTGNITHWKMSGVVSIKAGAAAGVVMLPTASTVTDEFEPYAPTNPANEWAWNDLNYVPSLGKAATNWQSRAAATFDLPEGTLRVVAPPNAYGRIGRWRWPDKTKRPRAVSDMVVLESPATGSLTLASPDGEIALTPQSGTLAIDIVSEVNPAQQVIKDGDPLGHLAMLYDFVDPTLGCNARPVPVYESITGRPPLNPSQLTPGVECPLGFLQE